MPFGFSDIGPIIPPVVSDIWWWWWWLAWHSPPWCFWAWSIRRGGGLR